jgi:nanoRNase/pAp phosphatase (c-di-AMP/oligoRNAs hydrolase)
MKVIFGHSNMDLDCFGSLVLASKLFPITGW